MSRSKPEPFKFKIPPQLQPLPKIPLETALNNRLTSSFTKSLVQSCCDALEKISLCANADNLPVWKTLSDIFRPSAQIATDSCRQLCHIEQPKNATQYILYKANSLGMTPCDYLNSIKIIRLETAAETRQETLRNHWKKLSPSLPRRYPCVLYGRRRKN